MSNSLDPTKRFSPRVSDYVKYRPDYPRQIIPLLHQTIALTPDWVVADVGCGTGISCRMFLEHGNAVFGVEPNADMLDAARGEYVAQSRFHPVSGAAEATTLADASVDLVLAAQAFHWFDRPACAVEWKRVLQPQPGGWVMLLWNTRLAEAGDFARDYDALLMKYGTDYKEVAHRTPITLDELTAIFGVPFDHLTLPNEQQFDLEGLKGRVRSSSYTPLPDQPGYEPLFNGLESLFNQYQQSGKVAFEYETEIFLGKVK